MGLGFGGGGGGLRLRGREAEGKTEERLHERLLAAERRTEAVGRGTDSHLPQAQGWGQRRWTGLTVIQKGWGDPFVQRRATAASWNRKSGPAGPCSTVRATSMHLGATTPGTDAPWGMHRGRRHAETICPDRDSLYV